MAPDRQVSFRGECEGMGRWFGDQFLVERGAASRSRKQGKRRLGFGEMQTQSSRGSTGGETNEVKC